MLFRSIISKGLINFDVILTPKNCQNNQIRVSLQAYIIESPIDVIIGRKAIKDFHLVNLFPSHFFASQSRPTNEGGPRKPASGRCVQETDAFLSDTVNDIKPKIVTAMHLR